MDLIPIPNNLSDLKKSFNIAELQIQRVFCQLLIAQINVEEINRLQHIRSYRKLLEARLFDPSMIPHLSQEELVEMYQISTKQESDIYNQNQKVIKDINLEEVSNNIQILQQTIGATLDTEELEDISEASAIANKLLQRVRLSSVNQNTTN